MSGQSALAGLRLLARPGLPAGPAAAGWEAAGPAAAGWAPMTGRGGR